MLLLWWARIPWSRWRSDGEVRLSARGDGRLGLSSHSLCTWGLSLRLLVLQCSSSQERGHFWMAIRSPAVSGAVGFVANGLKDALPSRPVHVLVTIDVRVAGKRGKRALGPLTTVVVVPRFPSFPRVGLQLIRSA